MGLFTKKTTVVAALALCGAGAAMALWTRCLSRMARAAAS